MANRRLFQGSQPQPETPDPAGGDPLEPALPLVAQPRGNGGWLWLLAPVALGAVTLYTLSQARTREAALEAAPMTQPAEGANYAASEQLPPIPEPPSPLPPPPPPEPEPTVYEEPIPEPPPIDPSRLRAPAMVVDMSEKPPAPAYDPNAAAASGAGSAAPSNLTADEQFAQRLAKAEIDTARAVALENVSTMVGQGAVIPAVLETALNSDLPGFARAVVSRDVWSLDGQQVLIPRGSRLIGERWRRVGARPGWS